MKYAGPLLTLLILTAIIALSISACAASDNAAARRLEAAAALEREKRETMLARADSTRDDWITLAIVFFCFATMAGGAFLFYDIIQTRRNRQAESSCLPATTLPRQPSQYTVPPMPHIVIVVVPQPGANRREVWDSVSTYAQDPDPFAQFALFE